MGQEQYTERRFSGLAPLAVLLLLLLLASGCATNQGEPFIDIPPPANLPTGRELIERYNTKLQGVDKLWSRATVTLRWVDRQGKRHRENGDDSKVILNLPDHVAIAVGKLGKTYAWLGCDSERYWFFDLSKEKTVYWGHHETYGLPGTKRLRIPVRPLELPFLMGLLQLDPNADVHVGWNRRMGCYILEPSGPGWRIAVDSETGLPRRIDLTDASGYTAIYAELSSPHTVAKAGLLRKDWPRINHRIDVRIPGEASEITLRLWPEQVDIDPSARKVNPRQFELPTLMRLFEPTRREQLDALLMPIDGNGGEEGTRTRSQGDRADETTPVTP